MRSSFIPTSATLIGLAGMTATAGAETEYEYILLQPLPGLNCCQVVAYDINENDVAVGQSTAGSGFAGFSWTESGGMKSLPIGIATSINNLDQVLSGNGNQVINAHTGSVVDNLGPSAFFDLNDTGAGVGGDDQPGPSCEPLNCPWDCTVPLLWKQGQGASYPASIQNLRALIAVNNDHVAIGQTVNGCSDQAAVVWNLNTGHVTNLSDLLPPIVGVGVQAQTTVFDISDAGDVVGLRTAGTDPERPFIWSAKSGFTILPTLPNGIQPGTNGVAYMNPKAINVNRQVVGDALKFSGGAQRVAFIYDAANGTRDLNSLVVLPPGHKLEYAYGINDNGWIVGAVRLPPLVNLGPLYGFVLKPIPQLTPGDVTHDGTVDVADLLAVINQWGACAAPPALCPADITDDGVVDVQDLLVVINNWS